MLHSSSLSDVGVWATLVNPCLLSDPDDSPSAGILERWHLSAEQCLRVKDEGFSIVLCILKVPTACTVACWVGGSVAALLVYRITLRAPQARRRQNCGESQQDHSGFCLGLAVGNPSPEKGLCS